MQAFYKHTVDLLESIKDCYSKRRILPCLVLLYAGIDVMASLEANQDEGTRSSFVRWTDLYLLRNRSFSFNSVDLFAARCAIVHTFTPDSDLYLKGKARRIAYAWGSAKASRLELSMEKLGYGDCLTVHMDDLIEAFQIAIADYLEDVERGHMRVEQFERAAYRWFANTTQETVEDFLIISEPNEQHEGKSSEDKPSN